MGLKHQVSKQKGKEYPAHGQYGWLWLSSTRRFTPQDATTVGLRAGPHRLAVKYTDTRNDSFKVKSNLNVSKLWVHSHWLSHRFLMTDSTWMCQKKFEDTSWFEFAI